jgi:hypothetical protein
MVCINKMDENESLCPVKREDRRAEVKNAPGDQDIPKDAQKPVFMG